MSLEEKEIASKEVKKPRKNRWLKRLLWFLLLLFLLPIIITLLTQIPIVQQWGSKRIASFLSKELKTEVSIDGFRLKWTDEVQFHHVLIRDLQRDTMIYVGSLDANFYNPIRGFLDGKVTVEGLSLKDAYINIKFEKDAIQSNLDQVFKGPPQVLDSVAAQVSPNIKIKSDKAEREYYLEELLMTDVRVRNYHGVKGKEENFYIPKGRITNATFLMSPFTIITDEFWFENPVVNISNFEYDTDRYAALFETPIVTDSNYVDEFPFNLTAKKAYITEGQLYLSNFRKSPVKKIKSDELDWNHLDVSHIEIDADSLYVKDWIFGAVLNSMRAETSSGLNIVDGQASRIRVTEEFAVLDDLHLETSMSTVDGDFKFIYDQYPDFRDFANEVRMDLQLDNSAVGIDDLIILIPNLKNNPFFRENNYELISINGRILGYVNNLKGRSLNLSLGKKFKVNGLIDIRDFTDPNRTRINFNLKDLSTDMRTIRDLVPNLNLPNNFDKLGDIKLAGEFNGLLKDFIAFGDIKTNMGSASFNMNLNFVNGGANAIYGGELDLKSFNLGQWSDNPDFGIVSLSTQISEGRGLTAESARANLNAEIKQFDFRGYAYRNATFSGLLDDKLISGNFNITDENIDLNAEGKIVIGSVPKIDVTGSLRHLDLNALQLFDSDLLLASDFEIDIENIDPDQFTGDIFLKDFSIGRAVDSMTTLDSLLISSVYTVDSNKLFTVSSEVLSLAVDGDFRILSLPNYFMNYFLKFNPTMANKVGLKVKEDLPLGQFSFDLDVHDTQGFLKLVTKGADTLRDIHLDGDLVGGESFQLKGDAPQVKIGNVVVNNFHLYAAGEGSYTNLVTSHGGMKVGKVNLSPLTIFGDLEKDTILYVFNEIDFQTYFDQINVEGRMYVADNMWQTELYNSALQMFGEDWEISDNNYLRFGPGKLLVRNLNLSHEDEFIKIKSINEDRGLAVNLQDFPLDKLNDLIHYDKIKFGGLISGGVQAISLKNLAEISANLNIPKMTINGDDFGEFDLTAKSDSPGEPVYVDMNLIKGKQRLLGLAEVIVPNKSQGVKGAINSQLTIEHFPASMLEYFITNGLSNTTGYFHGSISGVGDLVDPVIHGDINIPSSSFKIDILGTTYYLENQIVHIDSDLIDASGVQLKDKYGNVANVNGGITHHNLAKLGFNASMRSDQILMLETTKSDNELYYGTAFAEVFATFGGSVQRPIIRVEAENKANSSFVINNDNNERSGGLDFILFDFDTIAIDPQANSALLGVDFTLDMSINEGLQVQIILNESTRDIIRGNGRGDLIFRLNPAGEMSLFGEYVIDRGEYLFTYSVGGLVPVNKPFTIEKGSRLQWSGDPFGADVDIKADYTVVAAPYNLIADQFGASEEAKQKTDVNLKLLLQGPMLQPEIRFDIGFPELTGQVKSAVDIELARLRSDQTEMQNQAASLILFRDFASQTANAGASSVSVVANTISEWLSNQVSYYLTGLVSDLIANAEFIDDIQFDVGYRLPSGEFETAGTVTRSEVGISTKIIMFNRRLEASIKGDYVNGSEATTGASSSYFNTDLIFDYILTKDRRWRLRAYVKQDQFYLNRRTKGGLGLAWRREYDDLEEYKATIKQIQDERRAERIK